MAQSAVAPTKEEWTTFLTSCGIPEVEANNYAQTFVENRIAKASDLSKEVLKEMNITIIGDIIAITNQAKAGPKVSARPANITAPQLKSEMTPAEFRKFIVDWQVFKELSSIQDEQVALHIYNSCDTTVQNTIVNTIQNFFSLKTADIMVELENIVTKKSNPAVHRLTFSNLTQSETELVKEFVVRLKSTARL